MLTDKGMRPPDIDKLSTMAVMRLAQRQTQTKGNGYSDCLVVKPKTTSSYWKGRQPVARMWSRCGQKNGFLSGRLQISLNESFISCYDWGIPKCLLRSRLTIWDITIKCIPNRGKK